MGVHSRLRVRLMGADPGLTLEHLMEKEITIFEVIPVDDFCVEFSIAATEVNRVESMISRRGEVLKVVGKAGVGERLSKIRKRPILLLGAAIYLFLAIFLPTRVLFVQVEGNLTVPKNYILEQAAQCGVGFGASRREIRSEQVKNQLLERIPDLKWVGINTSGCVAVIRVTERASEQKSEDIPGVSNIIALRDGVIRSCSVQQGNLLCQVGQAVEEGNVLVSGYTDCGLSIRATRAIGEIYASTNRSIHVVFPEIYTQRGREVTCQKKYSLILGKIRINFYKDSRILDGSCVKMYTEKCLSLPGGFSIPIILAEEQLICYEKSAACYTESDAAQRMCSFAGGYLHEQMIAGEIISRRETVRTEPGRFLLDGEYACHEMIGRERYEETIGIHGKTG